MRLDQSIEIGFQHLHLACRCEPPLIEQGICSDTDSKRHQHVGLELDIDARQSKGGDQAK